MAKRDPAWIAKMDMTLSGQKVSKGQIIRPMGAVNDRRIFGENSHWAYRYDGTETVTCGSDGCSAEFPTLGLADRHRLLVHKPERDRREAEAAEAHRRAEEQGESIGGYEVVQEKSGPGGSVPYIKHPAAA